MIAAERLTRIAELSLSRMPGAGGGAGVDYFTFSRKMFDCSRLPTSCAFPRRIGAPHSSASSSVGRNNSISGQPLYPAFHGHKSITCTKHDSRLNMRATLYNTADWSFPILLSWLLARGCCMNTWAFDLGSEAYCHLHVGTEPGIFSCALCWMGLLFLLPLFQ